MIVGLLIFGASNNLYLRINSLSHQPPLQVGVPEAPQGAVVACAPERQVPQALLLATAKKRLLHYLPFLTLLTVPLYISGSLLLSHCLLLLRNILLPRMLCSTYSAIPDTCLFKYPIKLETLIFGGILTHKCT